MKYITPGLLWLALNGAAYAQTPQKTAAECGVEPLGHYLNMTIEEFDQSKDGWRSIGNAKEGCEQVTADLIAEYNANLLDKAAGLQIHEAQGRALGGQTSQALEVYKQALAHYSSVTGERRSEANILQIEANIAFLENNLPRLKAVRKKLAALPIPPGYAEGIARFKAKYPDKPTPTWPPYVSVVDGLIQCFGQHFARAFSCSLK